MVWPTLELDYKEGVDNTLYVYMSQIDEAPLRASRESRPVRRPNDAVCGQQEPHSYLEMGS